MKPRPASLLTHLNSVLRTHGPSIVALASLVIAVPSLWFTVEAQREERAYKELMIRPYVGKKVDTGDFSVGLYNLGLGPGIIVGIAVKMGEQCFASTDLNRWRTKAGEYQQYLMRSLAQEVLLKPPWNDARWGTKALVPEIRMSQPLLGYMIPAGGHIDIVRIENYETLNAEIRKDGEDAFSSYKAAFNAWGENLPIDLFICSMTHLYCGDIGQLTNCPKVDLLSSL